MKTPGGSATGRVVHDWLWPGSESLEHAEHDGADEGEGDIRGYNAQSADDESWEYSPGSRRARK